jgi:hypothetical protein
MGGDGRQHSAKGIKIIWDKKYIQDMLLAGILIALRYPNFRCIITVFVTQQVFLFLLKTAQFLPNPQHVLDILIKLAEHNNCTLETFSGVSRWWRI